ncbi:peptidoglycan bridge formation glycyltransferase FemA/FemB family protein [Fulvivirga sp. 29W222]|uniref:Peptidoglycan bridge formation glycyltransferase FemA/FemB family protein n=1 Tax=Fulvivirga marina TaxID=2494733 RepID=A0A937G1M0_9BACT|nr:peptidoglycan bridge formation glycyltransferase FemA/FemB family protein [Fulvivirga marina]
MKEKVVSKDSKLKYKEFCKNLDDLPIFSQDWWLDAVCQPQHWDVSVYEKGGKTVGVWPYFKTSKVGQEMLIMPPLTKFLGVYIDYPKNMNHSSRGSYEKEVVSGLLKGLPYKHLDQNFHYSFTNWLPLFWSGFSQQTHYSYCLDGNDSTNIFKQFKSQTKRDIRKAEKELTISESEDPKVLYQLVEQTYQSKGKNAPYSFEALQTLDQKCKEKESRKILLAKDGNNNVHSAIYLVWDKTSYYYLISGTNTSFKGSNANSLLIWHAIQEAISVGKTFDFEGSMVQSIERYFRSFGANQKPYFNLKHSKPKWLKLYFFLKNLK